MPKCVKGERCKAPGSEFDVDPGDSQDHPDWFYGVVTAARKTGCTMLFQGDDVGTKHDALETWNEHRVDDLEQGDYGFTRKRPKTPAPCRSNVCG